MAFPFCHVMAVSKVQRLYDACDLVFSSANERLPTRRQIRWLQELLDGMEAEDVGIDPGADVDGGMSSSSSDDDELRPRRSRRLLPAQMFTRIAYVHIHQCEDFSIGVFCFPAGATMPLHDHPEMMVLSKLLYGSMRIKSYDWVTEPCFTPRKCGIAKVVAEDEVRDARSETSVLFPRSGGNLHELTAVTPCALLDVLTPPYSEELGRPSTYFSDLPISFLPGFAILEERDLPEGFGVQGAPYLGPELMVDEEFYD